MSAERENALRDVARAAIEAGLAAVDPEMLVVADLESGGAERLSATAVTVVAVGKAAAGMARGAARVLGGRVRHGLVVCPEGEPAIVPPGFEVVRGGHPLPTGGSVEAARRVVETVGSAAAAESVLVLLSGGGSSLMTMPAPGLLLEEIRATTDALQAGGASISELNAVRKHLDRVKGGGLAGLTAAKITGLLLSDVAGDRLDVIASGPLSPDPSTFAEALSVVERRAVRAIPERVRTHLERGAAGDLPETSGDFDERAARIELRVVAGLGQALDAAASVAAAAGFAIERWPQELEGEAREAGRVLGGRVAEIAAGARHGRRVCVAAGGETTVTVRGAGRGGRNQETALAAAVEIAGIENVLVACCATDGVDGPTDAAGAWVDGETVERARSLGLDPERALADNDSYSLFAALGDLIVTGPTGTNVRDLALGLVG